MAGPDGRVVGGGVAGLLLAASPIQVSGFMIYSLLTLLMKGKGKYLVCHEGGYAMMTIVNTLIFFKIQSILQYCIIATTNHSQPPY